MSNHCRVCGKPLTVPSHIEAGIGPICAANLAAAEDGHEVEEPDLWFDKDERDIVCKRVVVEGKDYKRQFNFPHRVVRHSPTGMNWGYGGSGAADFALNALLMFISLEKAENIYQSFKWQFVTKIPYEGGTIKGSEILKFLKDNGVNDASKEEDDGGDSSDGEEDSSEKEV